MTNAPDIDTEVVVVGARCAGAATAMLLARQAAKSCSSTGPHHLIAPRRHVLDTILVNAAVDAGARLESGVTVSDVLRNDAGRVVGVTARDAATWAGRWPVR